MLDRDAVAARCDSMPGAVLDYPFDETTAVFKVGGKMFALLGASDDPGRVNLKVEPEFASDLVRDHDAIEPGYHMNKRHWVTVTLDGSVPDDLIDDLIGGSYELIVASLPKRLRP